MGIYRKFASFFILFLSIFSLQVLVASAIGNGNVDGGGGGDFGQGTNENKWLNGDEGVRVSIVQATDGTPVSAPIDLTNANPGNVVIHFRKNCKTSYRSGTSLIPNTSVYQCIKPEQPLPNIINTSSGGVNIEQIKSYFTDEQVIRGIAQQCGFNFNTLINGDYKLFLEPFAFVTFQGKRTAITATEAALYDRLLGGTMNSKMPSLSHKNLPLSMFLEIPDLGFPVWSGSRIEKTSNENIIAALGLGIVRFNETITPPDIETVDYEYRVNTEVITAVSISGGQSDPDNPVDVKFQINGTNYVVNNVYYPENASQLAWVKWRTPSIPQTIIITVTTNNGSPGKGTIIAKIVDLDGNDPPNPIADDRNDSYSIAEAVIPINPEKTSANWSIWKPQWKEYWVWNSNWVYYSRSHDYSCSDTCTSDHGRWVDEGEWKDEGWWEFDKNYYTASFDASMRLSPDIKAPTASQNTIKSGYGINIKVNTLVTTNQSVAVIGSQTAISYFPEFYYKTYWRLLDRTNDGRQATYQFKNNVYSTYNRRTHFTPIWMPDGQYRIYTYVLDCWTPDGMLSRNLTNSIRISGNLWSDWHIAPKK